MGIENQELRQKCEQFAQMIEKFNQEGRFLNPDHRIAGLSKEILRLNEVLKNKSLEFENLYSLYIQQVSTIKQLENHSIQAQQEVSRQLQSEVEEWKIKVRATEQ